MKWYDGLRLSDRLSVIFLECGTLEVGDAGLMLTDVRGSVPIPVGAVAAIMLEPGMSVTHAAVKLCAEADCLLVWTGQGGVRLYALGHPGGARSDRLLLQARAALDQKMRQATVRAMYAKRFGYEPPEDMSVDSMRGLEGNRVRTAYRKIAEEVGVEWKGRRYDRKNWNAGDPLNRALSAANSCLYGVVEAGILIAGYSPAVGFLHTGYRTAFVHDIADFYKFDVSVPAAFATVKESESDIERRVRYMLRDLFRKGRVLMRVLPDIEEVLSAGLGDEERASLAEGEVHSRIA
jgi:CRISPR-associated protein Cas1